MATSTYYPTCDSCGKSVAGKMEMKLASTDIELEHKECYVGRVNGKLGVWCARCFVPKEE